MRLTETYANESLHQGWWSTYFDPAQDAFNADLYRKVFARIPGAASAVLLDAGCGRGVHALSCRSHVARCVAVDLADDVLRTTTRPLMDARGVDQMALCSTALEELCFADATFDVVHCRGVLMHIPDWQRALAELCRVLKPGGALVIFETNHRSIETRLVLFLRRFGTRKSAVRHTPGGVEFWAEVDGKPFVVRSTDIAFMVRELARHGVELRSKLATEFWDLNRIPGRFRPLALRFNRMWAALRLPAVFSVGNALIGVKRGALSKA